MFVAVLGIVIERYVFSFLVEQEITGRRKALGEGRFAAKLMRKLIRFEHCLRVNPSGLRKSAIELEGRGSGVVSRLICEYKKLFFDGKLGIAKWNVGAPDGGWLHRGSLGRRPHHRDTRSKQKREQ